MYCSSRCTLYTVCTVVTLTRDKHVAHFILNGVILGINICTVVYAVHYRADALFRYKNKCSLHRTLYTVCTVLHILGVYTCCSFYSSRSYTRYKHM